MSTRSSLVHPEPLPTFPHHRFLFPLFPLTYKSLFPQLLSFLIYTNPRGVAYPPTHFPFSRFHFLASSLFSAISRLFASVAKVNVFPFSTIRTLFAKYRGWGASQRSNVPTCERSNALSILAFRVSSAFRIGQRFASSVRSRLNAALISAKCVNACGKFPSISPTALVCSAYKPR